MSTTNPIESAKKKAAFVAVDCHVRNHQVIGIGSGSTIVYAVERLAQRVNDEDLSVKCIPTSYQARQLILGHDLPLTSLDTDPRCSVTIDGCDEADKTLTLIKGGGGCLAQEKVVAAYSDEFVVIADARKNSAHLGISYEFVPIEVLPMAATPIKFAIQKHLGGKVSLRMGKAKAGPVVTDNSNFILDWYFKDGKPKEQIEHANWPEVNNFILTLPGVVETGLFVNMAKIAYFGMEDGSVKKVEA